MIDPELDRLLRELEAARRAAIARADAALRGDVVPPPRPVRTGRPAPVPARPAEPAVEPQPTPVRSPADLGVTAIPIPTPMPALGPTIAPTAPVDLDAELPPSAPEGLGRPRRSASGPLAAVARPVAALVLTAATVLGGWLLVLEPALGSRPVLVRDEQMSPSLRTGDVALAVAPDGPLGAGAIVAVRADGRRVVTRVIDREDVPADAADDVRAAAGVVVRADGEPLDVTTVVALTDVVGEVGAAVPRVGLPLVLLADPGRAPLGTGVVVLLLGLTAVGVRDLARERRDARQ